MNSRLCILISAGLLLITGCTRPYSTAPIPGDELLRPAGSSTPQLNSDQSGDITPQATGSTQDGEIQTEEEHYPFILQAGSPVWMANAMHPEVECNWMGVAGQVFDSQSMPILDLVMEVRGILAGNEVNRVSLTGIAPEYGEGGYEVLLSDRPEASSQALWIQIRDLSGNLLSEKVTFDTLEDCDRNLIIMNFVQAGTGEVTSYFLPIVHK